MVAFMIVPIFFLEVTNKLHTLNSASHQHPHNLLHFSKAVQQHAIGLLPKDDNSDAAVASSGKEITTDTKMASKGSAMKDKNTVMAQHLIFDNMDRDDSRVEDSHQNGDDGEEPASPLTRGVNKLPMSRTPALAGAERAHIQCDVPVDEERLVYWNSPQGDRDRVFETPFRPNDQEKTYYITFQPDRGGWNNIRMSMEILFVFAAATGRTLVLPPKLPLYLLGHGKEGARSFGDFFPLHNPELLAKIKIITMKEFIEKESPKWEGLSNEERQRLSRTSELCLNRPEKEEDLSCEFLAKHLRQRGFQPEIKPEKNCFIFDQNVLKKTATTDTASAASESLSDEAHLAVDRFCGHERKPVFYDNHLQSVEWINWDAGCGNSGDDHMCYRLLQHFYTFLYFTDPKIDNYYKRFVRDFLHYNDEVYCAAWKVIQAVQKDADELNVPWSTWHVRRGDLQYKKVKIPASEWYENTKEVWRPGELLYIATDERNKKFFDPVKEKHHPVRFLDDYWEIAGLSKLDSTYIGMVDTIVASHGRAFAGTWFSTFTGFINRLRGYLGKSMKNSWYSYLPRKDVMIEFAYPGGNYYAREWPIAWLSIDSDERIEVEQEVHDVDIHDKAKLNLPAPPEVKKDAKPIKYPVCFFAFQFP